MRKCEFIFWSNVLNVASLLSQGYKHRNRERRDKSVRLIIKASMCVCSSASDVWRCYIAPNFLFLLWETPPRFLDIARQSAEKLLNETKKKKVDKIRHQQSEKMMSKSEVAILSLG